MWGNRDAKAANTGTVQIYANGLCSGSSTLFQTETKVGEYILADSKKYLIVRIDSNTAAQVKASTLGSAVATVGAGNTYVLQQAPAFVAASEVNGNALEVYGIDANTEMRVSNGSVISIPVIFPGSGYSANAVLTVTTGNATGNAQSNSSGKISVVNITASGNSYTTAPASTIAAPTPRTFNANTGIATNFINLTTSFLSNGDIVTYANAAGNTAIAELTNGGRYYVVNAANASHVQLSDTLGGAAKTLTASTISETGHSLRGETALTGQAVISGIAGKVAHAGWVRRIVGTGGRAGRIQYETLVAMGSIEGDAEDTVAKDA
jgi:hypothetical protein